MAHEPTGGGDAAAVDPAVVVETAATVAELAAEREVLRQRIDTLENRAGRRQRLRRIGAAILLVLTCITFTAASVSVWARRNFLNTEVFVRRAAPLAEDPAVKDALSRRISAEVIAALDVQKIFVEVLPERGQILAVPLSNAVDGFIQSRVQTFVESPQFERLWAASVEQAHRTATQLLRGHETQLGAVVDGKVTLNLVPIIDQALAYIGQQSPELLGRTVNLPTVTVEELPAAATQRIEAALGVDLHDGYGEITVFESDQLSAAQDAIALFDKLTLLLVVLTLILVPLTLWVSPRTRRTLLQLVVGIAIGMVLVRRVGFRIEDDILGLVKVPENVPAVQVILDAFLDPLRNAALWVIAGLGVIAAVAVASGPYPWAVRMRHGVADGLRGLAAVVAGGAKDQHVASWLRAHKDRVRIGEAVGVVVVLVLFDISWLGILLLALVVGGIELVMGRVGTSDDDRPHDGPPPDTPQVAVG